MKDKGADTVKAVLTDLATEARRRGMYLAARGGRPRQDSGPDVRPASSERERERYLARADAHFDAADDINALAAGKS